MQTVPIVAVETHGSDTFYQSLALNRGDYGVVGNTPLMSDKLLKRIEARWDEDNQVHYSNLINGPVSRATSLGASTPAPAVVKKALTRQGGVKSVTVSDEMTMQAVLSLAGAFSMLLCLNHEKRLMMKLLCY
jgi:L-serine/L-threonine ammonia-lyase